MRPWYPRRRHCSGRRQIRWPTLWGGTRCESDSNPGFFVFSERCCRIYVRHRAGNGIRLRSEEPTRPECSCGQLESGRRPGINRLCLRYQWRFFQPGENGRGSAAEFRDRHRCCRRQFGSGLRYLVAGMRIQCNCSRCDNRLRCHRFIFQPWFLVGPDGPRIIDSLIDGGPIDVWQQERHIHGHPTGDWCDCTVEIGCGRRRHRRFGRRRPVAGDPDENGAGDLRQCHGTRISATTSGQRASGDRGRQSRLRTNSRHRL